MKITKEISDRTFKVAEEIHEYVNRVQPELPGKPFEDYVFTAIYTKLAEMELRLEALENKPQTLI